VSDNLKVGDRVITPSKEYAKVVHAYTDGLGTRMVYVKANGATRKELYQETSLRRV
jgi:hypothetical protein